MSADSHSMHNFLPVDGEGRADRSALSDPQARGLAEDRRGIIADYRDDVGDLRRSVTVAARSPLGLVLDGIDRVRGPLAPGEPAAQEVRRPTGSPQATPDPSVTSTAPAVWQPSPEIERLLAAAREGSPAALQTAQQGLQASALGQAWHARVDAHQQALDTQQRVSGPAAEPRTQAPLDIAR